MNKRFLIWVFWMAASVGILIVAAGISISSGSAAIPLAKLLPILKSGKGTVDYSIIVDIRLPRIILGIAIGGALSVGGVILQGMFRNPLVEPYTLGVSGGAALGVSLSILAGLSKYFGMISLPVAGFAGALGVMGLIYSLSMRKEVVSLQGLLLTGVMVSFIASSLIMLLLALSRTEDLHGIVFWMMGSLEETRWPMIRLMATASLCFLVTACIFWPYLNAFSIGEQEALHLGVPVEKVKRILFILTSLAAGFSVSVAGMIGFVGLVVPLCVRLFVGSDHRILLTVAFLSGGAFLILCDTIARTIIAPVELPVGVITGIIGGLLFIVAQMKGKGR